VLEPHSVASDPDGKLVARTKDHPSVILFRTADAPERITGWEVGAGWGDVRNPLLDYAGVFVAALLRAMPAKVNAMSVQPDDSQAGRGMKAICGNSGKLRGVQFSRYI
jgi:hypothetical protein